MTNALKTSLAHAMQRRATRPVGRRAAAQPRPVRVSLSQMPADRAHDFALFGSLASRYFREPERGGRRWARHQRMKSRSGYHVAPGLREVGGARGRTRGGQRFFEVFYGARDINGAHDLSSDRLNADWRASEETGAALLYRQGDDGAVTVYLYPARTDKLAPAEDAIVLDRITETAALTGRGIMAKHWRVLRAYAEVTSLDGEASPLDRARIGFLRLVKPQIRAGRVHSPEAWRTGLTVGALSLASALGAAAYAMATAIA